ncbi:extracellular matrix/biofilm biosynthesis regulator RemA family protein [Leptospirillum ferriphilum]|jgi:regulator of extracellular matrix RemA (YlzA/DUF370 family)|uniref:Putative regulatory protein Y981_07555 n=4 Tax=Leptospirillum TaxID=179 RepID=A0A059XQ25_9BACT|nr:MULTISPECIES: DUF370 domain-containing protein [Leptospirillum]EAY55876.1 MAG: conserved protein of unknown function [Leptospirillum rubarum]EDZ39236.1 MAG: Conserved protein of unknown function [Leptospirillum sp. Group II '5-way CG']EIJ76374.1 MAG: uncharacterized protein C75L2_00490127 [Leptospirillum sp. Group II 'C75']MCL5259500.1 DUF370 domain-containing protein [Nitrospirota bacterium]MDA8150362.1 DUF370 domain-containing protein [Nitrospiraceae bacterium]
MSNRYHGFVNIGLGNLVSLEHIISVVGVNSAPVRRMKDAAQEKSLLIDASEGRRTRSVIIMDSGHVILSALQPETLAARLNNWDEGLDSDGDPD